MKNRKYIRQEDVNSRTDGKGKTFAHKVFAENTELMFVDRHQGPDMRTGRVPFNRVIMTFTFHDFGYSICSKFKDTHDAEEALLVQYALDLMEDDTLEEYYKAGLLLLKNRLEESNKSMEILLGKYERGDYSWPITSKNVESYRTSHEAWTKIYETLDITEKDLKYFEQYQREGVSTGEARFAY